MSQENVATVRHRRGPSLDRPSPPLTDRSRPDRNPRRTESERRIKEPSPLPHLPFTIRVDHQGDSALVGLAGEFVLESKDAFTDAVDELGACPLHSLIVDLSQVTFLDSTALRLLTELWKDFEDRGTTVRFEAASDDARALLMLTGLDRVLPLSASATTPVTAPPADSPHWPDWNRPAWKLGHTHPGLGLPRPSGVRSRGHGWR